MESELKNLRKLDLNLLLIFEAIYSAGNISQAAKQLGVSQPTASNALSRLRDNLGDPLFTRASKGVEPTPKAVQMIGPIREALRMINSGVSDPGTFDPSQTRRHFRMVLLDQLEPILMPPVIRTIQSHKTITLETLHMWQTPIVESLNDGSLDLILTPFVNELKDFKCAEIGNADVVIAARQDHPEIHGTITRELFQSLSHIALVKELRKHTRMDEYLRAIDLPRHIAYTVTKFWSFPQIISDTDLVGVLPGAFARAAAERYPLAIYPLPFDLPDQRIYMIWKNNRDNDPGHIWLRDQITSAFNDSVIDSSPIVLPA